MSWPAAYTDYFYLAPRERAQASPIAMRKQMVTETCNIAKKRVPVLVCITDTSLEESLELADHAKQQGADVLGNGRTFLLAHIANRNARLFGTACA